MNTKIPNVWTSIKSLITNCSPSLLTSVGSLISLPSCSDNDRFIIVKCVHAHLLLSEGPHISLPKLTIFQHLVWERLNTGYWANVWSGWRDLYGLITVARVLEVAKLAEDFSVKQDVVLDVIRLCDMGIMLGGPVMGGIMEELAEVLTKSLVNHLDTTEEIYTSKKLKLSASSPSPSLDISCHSLKLKSSLLPIPSLTAPSIPTFITQCKLPRTATLIRDCMEDWPCMTGSTRWSCDRLVHLAGPRTVPVELGRKYTDNSWTQQLLTVEQFVSRYMKGTSTQTGYLAQHQLLDQVPALGQDIVTPDYCYTGEGEGEPDVNVWIGPGGTVSPAHTDKKHNVLCQVVGSKYVAIFYPEEGDKLYPHPSPMLANTSMVDLDCIDLETFPLVDKLQGYHTLLREGEMLYIPPMVWHYVRSLEESFSISFWWE